MSVITVVPIIDHQAGGHFYGIEFDGNQLTPFMSDCTSTALVNLLNLAMLFSSGSSVVRLLEHQVKTES